jgi:transposase
MGLVQARPETVDRRTQALNQLTSLRKTYDPQALELAGEDLGAPLALQFLRAGRVLAPRLAAAFGSDRTRCPDAVSFQKCAGLAPVRVKSGGQLWTHWRWQAPVFLRQSLVERAGQTVVWSAWAKSYYQRMQAKGKKHHVILRALAFKWVRILWKCWSARTPYNEQHYLKALQRKKSPNWPSTQGTA